MINEFIDLRSDTVTLPTEEMREAMATAEVGDSMRGEDPTANKLEKLTAELLGKEAAIFVPSGAMGNLICLMVHTRPGDEVILEVNSHIYYYERGAFAQIAGLSPRLVKGDYGILDPAKLEECIRPESPFFPPLRLLCIENTHNRAGGNAITLNEMKAIVEVARSHNIAIHLDGARIFNAATTLGIDIRSLTEIVDTVMLCLSKGLSAPVGSIVAGTTELIDRAKNIRKSLGGDMRQSGVIAAAGIVALTKMVDRLSEDHKNAALLSQAIRKIPQIEVVNPPNPTNMVFLEISKLGIDSFEFSTRLEQRNVLCTCYGKSLIRLVTHRHIDQEHIDPVAEAIECIVNEK